MERPGLSRPANEQPADHADAQERPSATQEESVDALVARVQEIEPGAGKSPVSGLNREAGNHPITTDPAELRAALRAGERTWEAFPYYEQRYGERGRRFTRSDSAWLASLADLPPEDAERHLRWLANLLAGRGMPRWLLESHLAVLHEALVAERPERAPAYAILRRMADAFQAERLQFIDAPTTDSLVAEFAERAGSTARRGPPESGRLIVASVADEAAGIVRAVSSLTVWLADADRYPPGWRVAVGETVTAARTVVQMGRSQWIEPS